MDVFIKCIIILMYKNQYERYENARPRPRSRIEFYPRPRRHPHWGRGFPAPSPSLLKTMKTWEGKS